MFYPALGTSVFPDCLKGQDLGSTDGAFPQKCASFLFFWPLLCLKEKSSVM